MDHYKTKSAVLFLIFNRPDTTSLVFQEIRKAKPAKLYIAADGPRSDQEIHLCDETRSIVSHIDWKCNVEFLYRQKNLGCKEAISSAIDWFFFHEEEGIILEDDCLPSASFFFYCDTLLNKYRYDTRIRHIAGCNLHMGKKWGEASIFYGNQTHVWGWASWRRVWKDYDKALLKYHENEIIEKMSNIFNDRFVLEEWKKIFVKVKLGEIDTWDYQLAFANYFNNGLSINPNVNLISNIGFRSDATHTFDSDSNYAGLPLEDVYDITYPIYVLPEKHADYAVMSRDFNLPAKWKKHNQVKYKLKRWFKHSLNIK